MLLKKEIPGLVTIIIPCYNHGKFLPKAIKSVVDQDYTNIEIIVIDDGSTDDTREIALSHSSIQYYHQTNKGLSAARNTGIQFSRGEYLIFLDADDWLLPDAIHINVSFLKSDGKIAFVSGGHLKVYDDEKIITETQEITKDHYQNLLKGNYIGMHATVMYRRCVFNEFKFDESLRNCEDYDLYLKISRSYPVLHHTNLIAAYRFHNANMSSNVPAMLNGVLNVLDKQKPALLNALEKKAFAEGKYIWKDYYCKELYKGLLQKKVKFDYKVFKTLSKYKPIVLLKYFLKKV